MDTFTFECLSDSILSLFESIPDYSYYNKYYQFEKLLRKYNFSKCVFYKERITSFIGDIDDFHDWLKLKLEEFFVDFGAHFFTTNQRINRRRCIAYRKIVKSIKRNPFKRKMMIELDSDIESCIVNELRMVYDNTDYIYSGAYTDTVENRRMLFLSFIKNYVYRLFLINEKVSDY